MTSVWNSDDSLTLSWTEPSETFGQTRIYFYDENGSDFFNAQIAPGVEEVTLSATLIQKLTDDSELQSASSIDWRMYTRSYSGDNNYARSISSAMPITWP